MEMFPREGATPWYNLFGVNEFVKHFDCQKRKTDRA